VSTDDKVLIETHIDDHCIALVVDVLDDEDAYAITFAGGFRNGERFDLDNVVLILKDEVDTLVKLPEAIIKEIPELNHDREAIKTWIHENWIDPADGRYAIEDMLIMAHLEEDHNDQL